MIVLLLLLTVFAQASGVMQPPEWRVLDEGCGTRAPGPDGAVAMDGSDALRVVGHQLGFTSAPGGPVTRHLFLPEPDAVTLRRQRCQAPDAGRWVHTGEACDDIPVLRWTGPVRSGERYSIGHEGSDVLQVRVSGPSRGASCPPPPIPPLYEEGPIRTETRQLTLPAGVVTVQNGSSWLRTAEFARAAGTPMLPGVTRAAGAVPLDGDGRLDVTLTLSRRRVRAEYEAEDGRHCRVSDQLSIRIDVDGSAASWTVGGEEPDSVEDRPGRCAR